MAIKKVYSKSGDLCKVKFTIPRTLGENFDRISLVGDFNEWDPNANIFTETDKKGNYILSIELPAGKEYQFRYLGDGEAWFNEPDADKHIETYFGDSENSVIII